MAAIISTVLLVGVISSALLIGCGFLTSFLVGWQGSILGAAMPDPFASPTSYSDLPARLAVLEPLAITQLGLIVLLATPVLRVATSVLAFALEGDRLYSAMTAAVLVVLLTSIFFLR